MTSDRYNTVIDELYATPKFTGEMSLDPITAAMTALDDPHQQFPAIHVAGTNGKGSTVKLTAAMLEAAGYTVGRYTSPHLEDVRERITINGVKIPKDEFVTLFQEIQALNTELSFFELTTAIAFTYFAGQNVDIAVIETGLGGRLDATNVLEPDVTVITNVEEDHRKWLGDSITEIAAEKAGIIKQDTPIVTGATGEALNVIQETAAERDAPLTTVAQTVKRISASAPELAASIGGASVRTRLYGTYQYHNIDTALAAIQELDGFEVSWTDIRDALARTTVPGRMEKLVDTPQVILDGGHNPAGITAAAPSIKRLQSGKTIVLASIMADKEYAAMIEAMRDYADRFIFSAAEINRAADPQDLAEHAGKVPHTVEADIESALKQAIDAADPDDTILVTGSLYFVGDVRARLTE